MTMNNPSDDYDDLDEAHGSSYEDLKKHPPTTEDLKKWKEYKSEADPELDTLLDQLNEEFFDGAIGQYKEGKRLLPVVRWANPWSDVHGGPANGKVIEDLIIQISWWLRRDPVKTREVLLHEMIHVFIRGMRGHDSEFGKHLARLAKRGEKWAAKELKKLKQTQWEEDQYVLTGKPQGPQP